MGERVSDKARQAGADRALFVGVVVAGVALSIRTAWIWVAQILWNGIYSVIYPLVNLCPNGTSTTATSSLSLFSPHRT